ncbi:MAG: antirestriction protein ArdA, partial [Enterococcus lemanii]
MPKLVTETMMVMQDGKKMGGDSKYWIYLTNLKAYNEGFLLGVYLHFPISNEDLEEAYKQILIGSEFIDKDGCSYEEYFISDYDMPFLVNEYDSPKELARRLEELEKYSHYPRKVIETIAENSGCTLT